MKSLFCSQCGARLVVGHVHGKERAHCPACGFVAFENPVPVGMALVEQEGKLVLTRRTLPPLSGYWSPPAGHVEIGESLPEAAIREAREETGLEIELGELIGVYSQAGVKVVIIAYRGQARGGELRAGDDAGEVALFARPPVQPPPKEGSAYDLWFYGVLEEVMAHWKGNSTQ